MEWTYSLLLPWAFGLLWILVPTKCSWEHEMMARHGQGCNSEQFECLSGECLALSVRCNDYPDCTDSSDEENCESVNCLEPRWFKCHNGRCISSAFVCDYDNDCADFSDEKNCSHTSDLSTQHTAGCSSSQFKCESDGVCIPNNWACDGSTDCLDSSDEVQGCYGKTICNGGFFCEANHHCLPLDFLCDGDVDCLGGADEKNCSKAEVSHIMDNCNVENHKFQCKDNSMCIELHQLCDHTPDCLDRSDEGGNCSNVAQCAAIKCSHDCAHTPTGPICICPRGSKLIGSDCIDIDECLQFGICDQQCINLNNSFRCACEPGYQLSSDGRSCKIEDGEGLLLFSTVTEVRGLNIKSSSYYPVATDLTQVIGVSYDGRYVYWTNIYEGQEAIVRSLKDGTDKSIILNSGLGAPEDLAVDLVTKNIYFTDPKMQHIGVCTNDGSACVVLHNKDIDKPRAICLQPNEGLMYWSDWGERPLIARSSMDGNELADFITTDIHWPNGITMDHGNGRLYWVDAKLLRIESIKLDGTDRRVVAAEAISHPFSIAVFEDSLYWSDFEGMEIQSCNKFTGKNIHSIVRETKHRIFGIHIYHESIKESLKIENPCEDSGCSDICLLASLSKPLRYTCACPEDKTLASNGHYCKKGKDAGAIMAGFGKTLILMEYKNLGKRNIVKMEVSGVEKIGAMAYDSLTGDVIISDSTAKKLLSVDYYNGHTTTLLSRDLGKVESLDVDPLGHNVYWVDSERLTVEVLSLKSLERTILMRDLGGEVPVDIVLAPNQGYMFIAFSGPRGTHVDRFYMNGLSRLHFVEDKLVGPSIDLTYDESLNQLFLADSGSGLIERLDVDGVERHNFQNLPGTPTSVATLQSEVYWATHASPVLEYSDKFQPEPSIKTIPLDIDVGWGTMKLIAITERVAGEIHNCQKRNGGCSHFCFVTPHTSVCGCPNGMELQSDGLTCEKPIQCKGFEFHCKTGECIAESLRCNHKNDCPDGDDELDCTQYTIQCPRGQYSCHNGEKCLEEHTKCDGHSDCRDKSDELNCHTHGKTCNPGDFECGSGECLNMRMRCDKVHDCKDSSDEADCGDTTCRPGFEFRCNDGSCLPVNWECDGQFDCVDGSDEHLNCVTETTCSSEQFTCGNGRCVENSLRCDGSDDCEDSSDETSCKASWDPDYDYAQVDYNIHEAIHFDDNKDPQITHKCNDETEIKCDSQPGVCLPKAARCNGTSECLRGEDESACHDCFNDEFECVSNKRCISREWICDNTNDCGDNSDEDPVMCKFHNNTAPKQAGTSTVIHCSSFECRNRQTCLPYKKVCDGHPDCEDGSDEGGRCGKSCINSGCQDICVETPYGPHCECSHGFQLMGDGRTCSDIDECKLGTYCSQYCSNTDGSFTCSCRHPDYMLRDDRMSCKAVGPKMKYVYALGNQIRYITQSYSLVGVVYNGKGIELRVSGLDVNARKNLIFWTSDLGGSLTKISLNNREETEVIKNLVRPMKLSVDWVTENVYFIENYNQIKVCHFGIKKCASIYSAKTGVKINALVVDPITRLMFWSEEVSVGHGLLIDHHNPRSEIKRADLGANHLVTVIDLDVQKITDIVVDSLHGVIYWLDAHHGKVDRSSFNGTNKQTIFQSPDIPLELGLFEDNIYWLVKGRNPQRQRELEIYGNVWHCGLSGPKVWRCEIIKIAPKNLLGWPNQFKIMHEALQPDERDPCQLVNCTHVCVLTQSGTCCICENGAHVYPGEVCKTNNTSGHTFVTEVQVTVKPKPSISWWLLTIILLMFVILPTIAAVVYFMYHDIIRLCCRNKNNKFIFSSFHFHNNPAYGDGTSHAESPFHHNMLDPGQHHYENPLLGKLNESNIVSSSEMNSFPNPKKLEFHLSDIQDDETSSVEYSDTFTDSHRLPLIQ